MSWLQVVALLNVKRSQAMMRCSSQDVLPPIVGEMRALSEPGPTANIILEHEADACVAS